jgi:hypothetical protein
VRNTQVIIIRGIIALNKGGRSNSISKDISKGKGKKRGNIRGKA